MRAMTTFLVCLSFFLAVPAHAYIGPGAGAGAIAVVFGVLASMFLALAAIVWYPIKRLFKGRQKPASREPQDEDADSKA